MKTSGRLAAVVGIGLVLAALYATDQILPPTSEYQAQMRIWMSARAAGIVSLILLTLLIVLGIVLSHPQQSRWKQSKRVFPWHESLWVFVMAFIAVHVAALVLDPYAGVGLAGAIFPGLSEYRSVPVALGVIAVYALALTVVTARYTSLLPSGTWLRLHRLSAVVLALAWGHGVLAGTDSRTLTPLYWGIALLVFGAAAYRYWVVRSRARSLARPSASPAGTPPQAIHTEERHVDPQPAP
jgi:sulfoxide reductase heme-binding subunit YedZ